MTKKTKLFTIDFLVGLANFILSFVIYFVLVKLKFVPNSKDAYFLIFILLFTILPAQFILNILFQVLYNYNSLQPEWQKKKLIYILINFWDLLIVYNYYLLFVFTDKCVITLLCIFTSLILIVLKLLILLAYKRYYEKLMFVKF